MKDKKLQVFVSSTYSDLKIERQAAVEAILSSGNIPAGMELFAAGDETQMTVIKRWIDESDLYLLLLGGRYGSVDVKSGKSYTQLEYEYATSINKPSFAVVISDKALDEKVKKEGRTVLENLNNKELLAFRENVLTKLVKFWEDPKDIKLAIFETLSEFSNRKDLIGWVKGDNVINAGALAEEIARLTKENSELRNEVIKFKEDTSASYSGLNFVQLRDLLKKEIFQIDNELINLFDFLITNVKDLIKGNTRISKIDFVKFKPFIDKLKEFKLIKEKESMYFGQDFIYYEITNDGHNFYLRTLV